MKASKSKECLPNLYRRGKGGILYMKFRYLGQNVHRSTLTTDPDLARIVVSNAKKQIFEEQNVTRQKVTAVPLVKLSQAIEDVYRERWAGNISGRNSYRMAYRVLSILGDIPLTEIDTKKVRQVHAHLRGEIPNEATVNRHMAAFRTTMRHAAESYNLPCPKFTLKDTETSRFKVYDRKEEGLMVRWFSENGQDEMSDLVAVLIDTGLRLSECLGIGRRNQKKQLISEFNRMKGTVTSWVNKGSKPRTIPLTKRANAILTARGSIPFSLGKHQFERRWQKMRDALSLGKDAVAHACRHTCASRLLETGSSILVVKEWLGHSSVEITMKYCHLSPKGLEEAAARLDCYP